MLQVTFEKDGVYLHTSAKRHPDQDSLIPGVIRIIEKVGQDGLLGGIERMFWHAWWELA